jgi:hypothetical protein
MFAEAVALHARCRDCRRWHEEHATCHPISFENPKSLWKEAAVRPDVPRLSNAFIDQPPSFGGDNMLLRRQR